MKNLKLGLLSIFLVFIGIGNVYADKICTYQNGTDYTVTCNTDNTKEIVECTISANNNYKIKDLDNKVSYDDFGSGCASSIKVKASVVNNKVEIEGIVSDANSAVCDTGENGYCTAVNKTNERNAFGSGNRGDGFGSGSRGEGFDTNDYLKDPAYIAALNDANKYCDSTDPINNDSVKCEEARKKMEEVKATYFAADQDEIDDYLKDPAYIAAYNDANKYCNTSDPINNDSVKCEEARKKMEEVKAAYLAATQNESIPWTGEFFCQRNEVKGTFRAIGWVFFILKIVVPIIIIIFGSIDFAKAVIASKDDEIKKSAVSLARRVAVGIIIFFIPTIIDFIVGIIGGNDIYDEKRGSFGYCTHCMLNPTDDSCGNLMGSDK